MCTFCVDRLEDSLKPACVDACNLRAMDIGSKAELLARYPGAVVPDTAGAVPGFPDPSRDHNGKPNQWGTAKPSILVRPRKPRPDVKGEWTIRHAGELVEKM